MPKVSAIALDLDGTLLNSQGEVSDVNVRALQRCAEKGLPLYLATARSSRSCGAVRTILDATACLTDRGVFYNGALAVDRQAGYCRHRPMSAALVDELTGYLATIAPETSSGWVTASM